MVVPGEFDQDQRKVEQAAAGAPGGEPVSDDPPTGLAKPALRGRGGTKYGDASRLTGGTSVEEVLSSSEDEAEREKAASDLAAAMARASLSFSPASIEVTFVVASLD